MEGTKRRQFTVAEGKGEGIYGRELFTAESSVTFLVVDFLLKPE